MIPQLHHGDCLEIMATLDANSIDAIVTDPPYGLAFMGKRWDYDVPSVAIWAECLRVLKPGGHLLAFAGTRTQHRMAVRIEDAGFEIRDMIAWVYGSGFPKSLDVSKAIDKAAGVEREKVRHKPRADTCGTMSGSSDSRPWIKRSREVGYHEVDGPIPATDAARQWSGWGTALKPALEPITMARKPLIGTVAANVLEHGTGGLNVDGCRVPADPNDPVHSAVWTSRPSAIRAGTVGFVTSNKPGDTRPCALPPGGRWPANLIHDGSEEVVGLFPQTTTGKPTVGSQPTTGEVFGVYAQRSTVGGGDSGSAARFFYCAKASKADRGDVNNHPTVKPTDLMRYLCRLVTPPGGVVLDPFMGSGSTGKAAMLEGFGFIGIEREADYVKIARARINAATPPLLQAMEGT